MQVTVEIIFLIFENWLSLDVQIVTSDLCCKRERNSLPKTVFASFKVRPCISRKHKHGLWRFRVSESVDRLKKQHQNTSSAQECCQLCGQLPWRKHWVLGR